METSASIYAPLPAPFMAHLRRHWLRIPTPPRLTEDALEQARQHLEQARQHLEQAFQEARAATDTDLTPLVQSGRLTMQALRRQIETGSGHRLADSTLRAWVGRGLLVKAAIGKPAPSSAAAILIMRRLMPQTMQRDWLPAELAPDEPRWWCWRQDAPDQARLPCPVPLPDDLPASALLWTPWSGAAWSSDWQAVAGGAVRWGGEPTLGDLARWGADLTAVPAADAAQTVARQQVAGYLD